MRFFLSILFLCVCVFYNHSTFAYTLHLMHTNDLHAHFLPSNQNNQVCTDQSPDCAGGFSRIKTLIDQERDKHKDLILLDAGDRFSGTIFYTLRKSQDLAPILKTFHYDALTIGNHELDDGTGEFRSFFDKVDTPVVASNVRFLKDSALDKQIASSKIITRNGKKIGIIGVLTEETKTACEHADEIEIEDVQTAVAREIQKLKRQGVHIIIVLSHIGYEEDQKLAQTVPGIHMIVGGHSHTILSSDPDNKEATGTYPTVVINPEQKPVLIVTAGVFGRYIGRLDVEFDEENTPIAWNGNALFVHSSIKPDPAIERRVNYAYQLVERQGQEKITTLKEDLLMTPQKSFCSESCHIGEVLSNALLQGAVGADIALLNAGGIRAGLSKGDMTLSDLIDVFPFDSKAVLIQMTGQQLIDYLSYALQSYSPTDRTNSFLQSAGLSYSFDEEARLPFNILIHGKPLQKNRTYTIVTASFLANGGDGFPVFKPIKTFPQTLRGILNQQLKKNPIPSFKNNIQKEEPSTLKKAA